MKNSFKPFLVFVLICLASAATGVSVFATQETSTRIPPSETSPRIDSISDLTLGRAGRLRIFGANFGGMETGSQVLIDGVPAPVSRWSDSLVVAYVPDGTQLATVPVQVVTKAGSSNSLWLEVKANSLDGNAPAANGNIKWKFEVDGDYMQFRPSIGPDGTIYFQDDNGHLYALTPAGGVKWIFQGGYPSGPVAVGADNTTYIASGHTIRAISPAGTLVWQFTDPGSQGVMGGPAVGPDGKVYAVTDLLGLGVIALSPADGHLVWSNPGNPIVAEYGQSGLELVFGPASAGAQPDQFYFACDDYTTAPQGHLYAFSLDGNQRWAVPAGGGTLVPPQAAVLPNGTVSLGVAGYNPSNGAVVWSAYSALDGGSNLPTDAGSDGTAYVIAQHWSTLAALNGQNGAVLWRVPFVSFEEGPVVSPRNDVVMTAGRDNYGLPGYFKAFSTSGQLLWQINLPGTPYPGIFEYPFLRGRFSADGSTVYMGVGVSGLPPGDEHCFLYALETANTQTCSYSINPITLSFPAAGAQGSLTVTAPTGCGWTARSNAEWIVITSALTGSGTSVVTFTVKQNFANGLRRGTISIADQTFTVSQDRSSVCTYAISPASRSFGQAGGTGTVSVTTSSSCGWTATSNASWIKITESASAIGNEVVTYSVLVNSSNLGRAATMLIAGKTFTVKQKPR